jgi:hypothetical protein
MKRGTTCVGTDAAAGLVTTEVSIDMVTFYLANRLGIASKYFCSEIPYVFGDGTSSS